MRDTVDQGLPPKFPAGLAGWVRRIDSIAAALSALIWARVRHFVTGMLEPVGYSRVHTTSSSAPEAVVDATDAAEPLAV